MNWMKYVIATVGVVCLVGMLGLCDTLYLADGTRMNGELTWVTAHELGFAPPEGPEKAIPLARVKTIELDWETNPEPRIALDEWLAAISKARRELEGCRAGKSGLVIGGLLFIGGGYWLGTQGYGTFGDLIIGLGAVATLFGIVAPPPSCGPILHRVEILTRIGLEHGWIY